MKRMIFCLLLAAGAFFFVTCENEVLADNPDANDMVDILALPVKAAVTGGGITGERYETVDGEIVVTLDEGDKFKSVYPSGSDVSSWFNVDLAAAGLTVKTKNVIAKNGKTATITISGVAIKTLEETPLIVAIPGERLDSGEAGRTDVDEAVSITIASPTPDEGAVAISTPAELAVIATERGDMLKGSYYLANDIDLSGYNPWYVIGRITGYDDWTYEPFTGVFDGNGHKITGLKLPPDPPKYITSAGPGSPTFQPSGLFGYLSGATVKNLTVELAENYDMRVYGASHHQFRLAVLAGYIEESSQNKDGPTTIAGVTVRGKIKVTYDTLYYDNQIQIGGLFSFGGDSATAITDCHAEVDIDITTKGSVWAGCFASRSGAAEIQHSSASGTINADPLLIGTYLKNSNLGGALYYYGGFISKSTGAVLSSCTADVGVNIKNMLPCKDLQESNPPKEPENPYIRLGGFVAWNESSKIRSCTSSGNITYEINQIGLPPSEEYVGPFIGITTGTPGIDADSGGTGKVTRKIKQ
jgi:hypothetical protein